MSQEQLTKTLAELTSRYIKTLSMAGVVAASLDAMPKPVSDPVVAFIENSAGMMESILAFITLQNDEMQAIIERSDAVSESANALLSFYDNLPADTPLGEAVAKLRTALRGQ